MTPGERTVAGPAPARRRPPGLERFDRVERVVHWTNAVLFGILILTGLALFWAPLTGLVGRRELVERIHVYAGIALPVPLLAALAGSWGRALRVDVGRLNRWSTADRRWLVVSGKPRPVRTRTRTQLPLGKFNAGQKLNAAFTAGGGLVMLGTGLILRWYRPFPLSIRAGATFVHNWLFVGFVVVIAGHVLFALADPEAMVSMISGRISVPWARRHAPAWLAEIDPAAAADHPLAGAAAPVWAADPIGAADPPPR